MKLPWSFRNTEQSYSIYTRAYDVELSGAALTRQLTPEERRAWNQKIEAYRSAVDIAFTKASVNMLSSVDRALSSAPDAATTTAVSLLIDHSGSLKGQRAIIACLLAQVIGDFLSRLGVQYEILGFTTAAWRGGQSRRRWDALGRPRRPGRLNDLLHIKYREASDTVPGAAFEVHHLLRNDLLKENIDGEAVFWAAERLKDLNRARNILIVVSDGAPVDDSTLQQNGLDYLLNHLVAVVSDIEDTPGFRIAGIGIDHDVGKFYPDALRIDRLDDVSTRLPGFLATLFDPVR